ncbi:sensor histidine kinase [Cohnella fermenti]|nr:sensor histidine kinase [Cohnella fermenti]
MRAWMYSSSFRTRIWIALVAFTVVSIALTGISSYLIASRVIGSKATELSQNMINKSAQALEQKMKNIRISALSFMISDPMADIVNAAAKPGTLTFYDTFRLNEELQTPLYQLKLVEPAILSVLVVTPIGEFYMNKDNRDENVPFENTLLSLRLTNNRLPLWVEAHEDELFDSKTRVLSLLLEPASRGANGDIRVIVNVSEEALRQFITDNLEKESGQFLLFSESGQQVIAPSGEAEEAAADPGFAAELSGEGGSFRYRKGDRDELVNYSRIDFPTNWVLVFLQDRQLVFRDIRSIQWGGLAVFFGLAPLALFLAGRMAVLLLRPLHQLQLLMRRVEDNNLNVRYSSPYRDEFALVGLRFNQMLEKIGELIGHVTQAEREKRLLEIKALQAQINPHFLYNTLNTILWKSETARHGDVQEMIVSLSQLFRLGLNNGQEMTPLGKELDHVTEYMRLQQQCYEDLFVFEISVNDEELLDLPVPKLLLQPLVENSILHGFEELEDLGLISISVVGSPDWLIIRIADNGKGFETAEPEGGYALGNIRRRLLLYFGETATMTFRSRPFSWTEVELKLPMAQLRF